MKVLLRPVWLVGHLLVVIAVVGFVDLGLWQLDRHAEKVAIRDQVAAAQNLTPTPIEQVEAAAYQRVYATGSFDPALQVSVLRSRQGVSGHHVLTPFVFADGFGVLVDRGWIPAGADMPDPPEGMLTIEGTLWPAEKGSGDPGGLRDVVRRIDPWIVQPFASYLLLDGYLLLATEVGGDGVQPLLPPTPEIALGPHVAYAVQWFLFAGVVVIGYPILLRKTVRSASLAVDHPVGDQQDPDDL